MFVIGISSILILFTSSLNPSEKAKSERSQHDISKLQAGSYIFEFLKRDNLLNRKVLIIKDWNDELFVHFLPTKDGAVTLPDIYWSWVVTTCIDFGPETESNGNILNSGKIRCHDIDEPAGWSFDNWQWGYNGKSLVEWKPDLISPKYEIKDGILYVNS